MLTAPCVGGFNIEPLSGVFNKIPAVVTEVSPATVIVDANHPLAGKDLTFEIQLLEVV